MAALCALIKGWFGRGDIGKAGGLHSRFGYTPELSGQCFVEFLGLFPLDNSPVIVASVLIVDDKGSKTQAQAFLEKQHAPYPTVVIIEGFVF